MTVIRNALKASLAGMLFAGLLSSPAAASAVIVINGRYGRDKPALLPLAKKTTRMAGKATFEAK